LTYARRMGQPTQRSTNYTARSNIETAQIFLHANGQSAPRSGGARDVGRGAGSHTPSTASESLRVLAFTRYSFTSTRVCTSPSPFNCPPPHIQCPHSYNTIARPLRNKRPLPDPPCVCHTPNNIGNGNK